MNDTAKLMMHRLISRERGMRLDGAQSTTGPPLLSGIGTNSLSCPCQKSGIETEKVIARQFRSDEIFIIGSQSILLSWPDAPVMLRISGEIDAYPGNAKLWEIAGKELDPDDDPEASEEIAVLFGEGSAFHRKHGFYIDGVDENTARLPHGWMSRAIVRSVDVDGRIVRAIAPCPEDVIVSKLAGWMRRTRISLRPAIRPDRSTRG